MNRNIDTDLLFASAVAVVGEQAAHQIARVYDTLEAFYEKGLRVVADKAYDNGYDSGYDDGYADAEDTYEGPEDTVIEWDGYGEPPPAPPSDDDAYKALQALYANEPLA